MKAATKLSVYKFHLFARKIICLLLLTAINFSGCWTVKILNLTDEKITIDIKSSQIYPGLKAGKPTKRKCEFIDKQIDAHASRDFNYKDVHPICIGACTKSVSISSPVKLSSEKKLTSCSNVVAIVRKDASNKWTIKYHDWTAGILKMIEERTKMPTAIRETYDTFGDSPIQSLSVFRKPIQSGVKELIEVVTKNERKQLNYDQLYHTGFIIKCRDQLIKLERTQTISSSMFENKKDLEQKEIELPGTIRYDEFINKAMENDPNFWKYHPINNNCQLFVLQCLEKNNIKVSDELYAFIYQDAGKVLANSPGLKKFAIGVTSLANRIDKIIEGTSDITIQNGTPYTLRIKTRYTGESKRLKTCQADDFLLESGREKSVSHGFCLLKGIKVAASLKGADAIKTIPHKELQKTADIFAEKSFVGRGKANTSFLIQSAKGKKITIENIKNQLSAAELQQIATAARANPDLNLNLKEKVATK